MNIVLQAEIYAKKCHRDTNHQYDGKPYEVHLAHVVSIGRRFIDLVPVIDEKRYTWGDICIAACWAHDVIEDTRQTYNDVKKELGYLVADIVYALTNEKGKTRKERADERYYKGIHKTAYAPFVKICDRIANIEYSINKNPTMAWMYYLEQEEFKARLYDEKYKPMFDYIDELFARSLTPTQSSST
jgi:(p)ppGpp synthase/HD superfamily hydrolase